MLRVTRKISIIGTKCETEVEMPHLPNLVNKDNGDG